MSNSYLQTRCEILWIYSMTIRGCRVGPILVHEPNSNRMQTVSACFPTQERQWNKQVRFDIIMKTANTPRNVICVKIPHSEWNVNWHFVGHGVFDFLTSHTMSAILATLQPIQSIIYNVSGNFISLVTSCIRLREEEPQTAFPVSFTWVSHIAATMRILSHREGVGWNTTSVEQK